jgi:hypothetical protein
VIELLCLGLFACLALGAYATARGNRFKARGRIQLHGLHAEGEVESSPVDDPTNPRR